MDWSLKKAQLIVSDMEKLSKWWPSMTNFEMPLRKNFGEVYTRLGSAGRFNGMAWSSRKGKWGDNYKGKSNCSFALMKNQSPPYRSAAMQPKQSGKYYYYRVLSNARADLNALSFDRRDFIIPCGIGSLSRWKPLVRCCLRWYAGAKPAIKGIRLDAAAHEKFTLPVSVVTAK